MSPRNARRSAIAVTVLVIVLGVVIVTMAVLLQTDGRYREHHSIWHDAPDVIMALAFALVGVVLILKRPANLVGWALSLAGLGLLAGGALGAYAELALLTQRGAGLPAGATVGALGTGSWTPLMAGVFLLFLTFPGGGFPSPRWRRVARLVLLGFALVWAIISLSPGSLDPPLEHYRNPLAVTDSHLLVIALVPVIAGCLGSLVLAGVDLVRRFRRSRGLERQQFKWVATSAGLLVVALPFAGFFNWSEIAGAIFTVLLVALPVSVGIAVLRYRLYEIDVIIRRTLVYGALTGILAVCYLGIVLALQQVFSSVAGGSNLAIAGSTLAVAALFRPVRNRIQALVDRRFYRRKYDAEHTLAAFSAHLRVEVDLDALRAELAAVGARTMQPAHVSLWLREAE